MSFTSEVSSPPVNERTFSLFKPTFGKPSAALRLQISSHDDVPLPVTPVLLLKEELVLTPSPRYLNAVPGTYEKTQQRVFPGPPENTYPP